MDQYHALLKEILGRGDVQYEPRTQEYIIGISGSQSVYDLRKGFPLITTKNVPPRLPFEELFWKLRGERSVKSLVDRNVNIWTANAFDRYLKRRGLYKGVPKHSAIWNEKFKIYSEYLKDLEDPNSDKGDLGPVYGYNWRYDQDSDGNRIDQLVNLINGIKKSPGSRYHILSSWNVSRLKDGAIGPCPFWHQFTVWGENIDLHMIQRSNDSFLGVPFNIAEDSALTHLVAKETGYKPRFFIHTPINAHIYLGVKPRSEFWMDSKNVKEFQRKFNKIKGKKGYLKLKKWYLRFAPEESKGNEKKDHVPFILEQLSKEPRDLPTLEFKQDIPFFEAIERPPLDVFEVKGYNPHNWASKAEMAA